MSYFAVRSFSAGGSASGPMRISGYDSPLAANPNDLALTLNLIIAWATGLYFATRRRRSRVLIVAAIVVMVAGVIVSFSRAGFLMLATMVVAFLWQRARGRDAVTIVGAVALIIAVSWVAPSGYGDRVYSIFDFKADPTGSAQARWDGTWIGIELIKERPLFGYGLAAHGLAFVERGAGWTAVHNAVISVGADAGVLAMVAYIVVIYQLFRQLGRVRRRFRERKAHMEDGLAMGVQISMIGFGLCTFFYPVQYHFYLFYIIGFTMALQVMARRELRDTAPVTPPTLPTSARARR
jgi:O-Antigen ligase